MMKQVLIAALAVCANASLFIQQSDFGAQFTYTTSGTVNPLSSALFTDSVNGVAPTDVSLYNPYGILYYNGVSRGFSPTGNWLLVSDPISNNYGDYSSPIFTVPTVNTGASNVWSVLQVPRNPFTTFHAVVVAAGPNTQWTSPGDIVVFQPHHNISQQLLAYNPLDLFSYQLASGANSVQTTAATIPTANTGSGATTSYGFPLNWICLGQQVVLMNPSGDLTSFLGAANPNALDAFRTRGAYCLVPESEVVARVDIAPDSGYPSLQRATLASRLSALQGAPTEFGLTTLA